MEKSTVYQIKIKGELDPSLSDRLGGMCITEGTSKIVILEGPLADQAALSGVLATLYEMHLPVLQVMALHELDELENGTL